MQVGLAEIQKNVAILTTLTEPLQIVDKRHRQVIATVYPKIVTHNARRLAGKYCDRMAPALRDIPFEEACESSMLSVIKEKYGISD